MKILVTGGCGYIGSHTVIALLQAGYEVIIIDNLSNSTRFPLLQIEKICGKMPTYYEADLRNTYALLKIFDAHQPDGIIHFAAAKSVPESVERPTYYYENNIGGLMQLLEMCKHFATPYFVFSSSCSVYGNTTHLPVTEETPFGKALCPYALTKQISEQLTNDAAQYLSTKFINLRYFNPAGGHPSGLLGEIPTHTPKNLILAITETAIGNQDHLKIFGDTYATPDGSCIRDYIHVCDVADAHLNALQFLSQQADDTKAYTFNIGIGKGTSVLEAVDCFEKRTGIVLNKKIEPARKGDVASIYCDTSKAQKVMGWKAKYSLEEIIDSAWQFTQYTQSLNKQNDALN